MAYEAYGCMLTGFWGEHLHLVPRILDYIRRVDELSKLSPVSSGQRHWLGSPESTLNFGFGHRIASNQKRNHRPRWIADDMEAGMYKPVTVISTQCFISFHLCFRSLFLFFLAILITMICKQISVEYWHARVYIFIFISRVAYYSPCFGHIRCLWRYREACRRKILCDTSVLYSLSKFIPGKPVSDLHSSICWKHGTF